jgi:hypothetical protein
VLCAHVWCNPTPLRMDVDSLWREVGKGVCQAPLEYEVGRVPLLVVRLACYAPWLWIGVLQRSAPCGKHV